MTENTNTQQPIDPIIELKLPVSAINVILEGLDSLPHRVSRRVWDEVMAQGRTQVPAQAPAQAPAADSAA